MSDIFNPLPGEAFNKEGEKVDPIAIAPPAAESATTTTTEAPPAEQQPAAPIVPTVDTPAPVEINWEERTGGKFKSWDEISAKLSEQPTSAEIQYANEQSKTIAQYIAQGKLDDVRQVLNDQHRLAGVDKISDEEAIRLQLEFKNPQFKTEDIHEEFADKYKLDKPVAPVKADYIDDDAYDFEMKSYKSDLTKYEKEQKKLDRQLKVDAATAREELRTLKSDIVLPDITPAQAAAVSPAIDEAQLAAEMAEFNKNRQSYLTSLNKSAEEFKSIPFTVNDEGVNVEVSYAIDAAEVAAIKKDLAEKSVIDDILLPRYDKGDVYDTKQLVEDIYWLNNKEKIITNAIKQAIAQDRLKDLKDRKNVNLDGNQRGDFTPSTEAVYQEFGDKFLNAG